MPAVPLDISLSPRRLTIVAASVASAVETIARSVLHQLVLNLLIWDPDCARETPHPAGEDGGDMFLLVPRSLHANSISLYLAET